MRFIAGGLPDFGWSSPSYASVGFAMYIELEIQDT